MSQPLYAPRLRAERFIAAGRVVLAVSSLFAVWLDPDEPVRYAPIAYAFLAAYVVYASAVAAFVWRAETVSTRWPTVMHIGDLVFFSLFILFTEGPASPFTVYFVFALLCATLRWQARGTFWTALVVLGAFIGLGIYFGFVLQDPEFDLRALIIRGVYMFVLAALLGYVGAQDQRTLREMWQIASWPQTMRRDGESLVRDLLEYAAQLIEAPRVVLAWSEPDTPRRHFAVWDRGTWTYEQQPSDIELVHGAVGDRAFMRTGTPSPRTLVQETSGVHLTAWSGEPIAAELGRRFGIGAVLSVPLLSESIEGRLFVFDKSDSTLDHLVLAEIVAGVIAARLDAFSLAEQLRQTAATEERIRLSRDLHDGVLQSFTGIGLRLAVVRRMMDGDKAAAAAALEDVQRVLASEQRDVRFFIQELKPTSSPAEGAPLDVRLTELAQRMEREWDLRVDLTVEAPRDGLLPSPLVRDLYHIVREALINAARHGAASSARVTIAASDDETIAISIADNGCGFSFSGRYSADDLARMDLGPKTLRERVRAMNGSLMLESSSAGAELNVVLPLTTAA